MDYDATAMPAVYDAGRGYPPEVLQFWLTAFSRASGRDRFEAILDLGCGTGRYSAALAAHFQARVVGVDPSLKMLQEAAGKAEATVTFLRGSGEAVPVGDAAFDLVFLSMVFHHFDDPVGAIRECRRVLRGDGLVILRAGAAERIPLYPYVPFFPSARSILEKDLLPAHGVQHMFEQGGFACRYHEIISSPVAATWRDYADKVALRADSILAQLGEEEFAEGLRRLREHAARAAIEEPVVEPVELFVFEKARPKRRRN